MPAIAGFGGRIIINGSTMLRAHRWTVDWKVQDFDVTSFENSNYGNYIGGLKDADISIDAYWDTVDDPLNVSAASLVTLVPGLFIDIQILYDKATPGSRRWRFTHALVLTARNETGVRDVNHVSFTARAAVTQSSEVPTIPVA